jgi:hypothetical protein
MELKFTHEDLQDAEKRASQALGGGSKAPEPPEDWPQKADKIAKCCVEIINVLREHVDVSAAFVAVATVAGNLAHNMSKDGQELANVERMRGIMCDYVTKHEGKPKMRL